MLGTIGQTVLAIALGTSCFGQDAGAKAGGAATSNAASTSPGTGTNLQLNSQNTPSPTAAVSVFGGNWCVSQSTCCCNECKRKLIRFPKLLCFQDHSCDSCGNCSKKSKCGQCGDGACGQVDGGGCGSCAKAKCVKAGCGKCKTKTCTPECDSQLKCALHEIGYGVARTFWKIGDCCSCCDNCGNGAQRRLVAIKPINAQTCCISPQPEPCCCKPKCANPCKKSCAAGCEPAGCKTCASPGCAAALTESPKPISTLQPLAQPPAVAVKANKRSVFAPKPAAVALKETAKVDIKQWITAKPLVETSAASAKPVDGKSVALPAPVVQMGGAVASESVKRTVTPIPNFAEQQTVVAANGAAAADAMPTALAAPPSMPVVAPSAFATHAPDHSWLLGRLERLEGRGGAWILRYGAPAERDAHGGMVVLAFDRRLNRFRPGEIVRVQGKIVGPEMKAYLGGPLYRIDSIERSAQ